jgi:hypothetical protein
MDKKNCFMLKLIINFAFLIGLCSCHGFLQDPPQRGRQGNDLMAGPCGGAVYMVSGTIRKRYKTGQNITIHSSVSYHNR